jgi:hypothetical protein
MALGESTPFCILCARSKADGFGKCLNCGTVFDDKDVGMTDDVLKLKCPCGESLGIDLCDGDGADMVTYWAEDGPVERECGMCGATVKIQEHVRRTWEVMK